MAFDDILDRTIVFSFSNIGYKLRSRTYHDIPRMDGKTVVITGATAGLGKAAAEALSSLGADVILVGRNESKLTSVQATLGPTAEIEVCDLSIIGETRDLVRRLNERHRIDVLINNAGAMFAERDLTKEGLEQTFALNLLSGFVLTEGLIPKLIESAPSRIINMSSGGMYSRRLDVSDLQNSTDYKPSDAYAHTKRAQVVLTEMWANELSSAGVSVHAAHPGWADTDGVKDSLPTFQKVSRPFLRSPAEGADTVVWLSASDPGPLGTGSFWHDRAARPTHYMKGTAESPEDRVALHEELTQVAASV